MDRKKFLITSTLTAFSLAACGSIIKKENGEFIGDCDTTNDILGPFYRPDAPIRRDLTFSGLVGNKIQLKGIVYKSDCITPLKDAQVEIWHCNTEGEYDNHTSDLNGGLYRPSHIHFRITEANSKELVSQIYFNGDPHIAKDPWASQIQAKQRILPIVLEDVKGNLVINFPIYLSEK